jgi:hypothetical protein
MTWDWRVCTGSVGIRILTLTLWRYAGGRSAVDRGREEGGVLYREGGRSAVEGGRYAVEGGREECCRGREGGVL